MYALALVRPGVPTDRRTAETGGEIRTALWDLVRGAGFDIRDEHHSELMNLAGDVRNRADAEGFGVLLLEGLGALTVTDLD
jgi:hypothetical protein